MCANVWLHKALALAYWKPGEGGAVACDYMYNATLRGHGMEESGGALMQSARALAGALQR